MAMKLKRAPAVSQDTIARWLQSAGQAVARCDIKEALKILERARTLAPGNPDILLQLGQAHGLNFDYETAGNNFEKAVHFSNQKTLTLSKAAAIAHTFYKLDLAEHFLRRTTEQNDASPANWVQMAKFLERTRRISETSRCLEQAYKLNPSLPEIPLINAKLARQANCLEEAEKLLRCALPLTKSSLRVECLYELASTLDQQGRYDDAMASLLEAKAPFQNHNQATRGQREALYTKRRVALAGLNAAVFQRWFEAAPQLQPTRRVALLGGYPRSGTTLLEQVLDSHPDVIAAEETTIFPQDVCVPLAKTKPPEPDLGDPAAFQINLKTLEGSSTELLRRLRENYFGSMERCLGQPIAGRLLVDKNPMLWMLMICGFPRIFPEAKLLVALRDPRDICLSCFMQRLPRHIDLRRTAYFRLSDIVEQYVEEMSIWQTLKTFIPGHYLELRYEDMVEDLEPVARQALDFLDVPWDSGVLSFHQMAQQKLMGHKNYQDVSKPVYQRARQRWRHYEKYFEPYQEKLAPFVKAFGYE